MSALLLTVVVLGVCVTVVVIDLLVGPDQPATGMPRYHADYGGPWQSWLESARAWWERARNRMAIGARSGSRTARRLARRGANRSKDAGLAVRESWTAVKARRRALAQRQAAHARYVAHLEQVAPSRRAPPPEVVSPNGVGPVPESPAVTGLAGVHGLDDGVGLADQLELTDVADSSDAIDLTGADESVDLAETPTTEPGRPVRSPPWPAPVGPPRALLRPDELQQSGGQARPLTGPRHMPGVAAFVDDDVVEAGRGFLVPLSVPLWARARSALLLVVIMSALGLVVAVIVLMVLAVIVDALAGL